MEKKESPKEERAVKPVISLPSSPHLAMTEGSCWFSRAAGLPNMGDVPCPQDAQELSDVERAIETLIKNFHQYSVEGGKETLTPSELRDLVTQQLPHLMPVLRE